MTAGTAGPANTKTYLEIAREEWKAQGLRLFVIRHSKTRERWADAWAFNSDAALDLFAQRAFGYADRHGLRNSRAHYFGPSHEHLFAEEVPV